MGRRGPISDKGKAIHAGRNRAEPVEIGGPPDHLRDEAKAIWRAVVEVAPEGALTAADAFLLETLADAITDYRDARRVLAAEGDYIKSNNGMHRHPAQVSLQQHRSAMRACFAELGLSPQARARIGLGSAAGEQDELEDMLSSE